MATWERENGHHQRGLSGTSDPCGACGGSRNRSHAEAQGRREGKRRRREKAGTWGIEQEATEKRELRLSRIRRSVSWAAPIMAGSRWPTSAERLLTTEARQRQEEKRKGVNVRR